jgi:DNA-binding NarL/FixJ family response regulator
MRSQYRDGTDQMAAGAVRMPNDRDSCADDADPNGMRPEQVWGTLELCAAGLTTAKVADRLGADPDTVRRRVERAKALLGARSKLEAVVRALRSGLIAPPAPHDALAPHPDPTIVARTGSTDSQPPLMAS